MSFTLCTSGSAVFKAGEGANTDISTSGSALQEWSTQAEGRIESETRRTWVANHAGLPTGIKGILSDACSSLMAMNIINWDMSGYTSRQEATTMLDIQDSIANDGLKILKDFKSNELKTP